jgi:hypothetical protein
MKTLLLIFALALAPFANAGERFVLGLSPFLQKAEKDEVFRKIAGFILEDAPLGSSLWIYDAFHVRTITQIDIPDVRAFRSGKTRANQFKTQIGQLRTFLASEHPKPEAADLDFDRALRLPQFLDFVGENLASGSQATVVLLLGSPLNIDAKEPAFSMTGGAFPTDGHILAARDQTVYGLKERGAPLKNVTVHHCWFGDPWVSEVYREKIARFWTLYLETQGAALATFCGDLPTAFNALKAGPLEKREPLYTLDRASTKIEMVRVSRTVAASDWLTSDLVSNLATTPPSTTVGPMKIGIRWQGNLDLDLYATPAPGSQTLFFEHTRSPEGYYFKDHRSSPDREYEFIEFEAPVDLWQVQASINFFEGRSSTPPRGEVRIEFAGRIYSGDFQLAARRGNEGRTGPDQAAYWTEIDLPRILKLRPSPAPAAGGQ